MPLIIDEYPYQPSTRASRPNTIPIPSPTAIDRLHARSSRALGPTGGSAGTPSAFPLILSAIPRTMPTRTPTLSPAPVHAPIQARSPREENDGPEVTRPIVKALTPPATNALPSRTQDAMVSSGLNARMIAILSPEAIPRGHKTVRPIPTPYTTALINALAVRRVIPGRNERDVQRRGAAWPSTNETSRLPAAPTSTPVRYPPPSGMLSPCFQT